MQINHIHEISAGRSRQRTQQTGNIFGYDDFAAPGSPLHGRIAEIRNDDMQRRALFHNQSAAYIIHLHHRGIADGSGDIDGRTVAYLPCFKETVIVFPVRKAGVLDFAEAEIDFRRSRGYFSARKA